MLSTTVYRQLICSSPNLFILSHTHTYNRESIKVVGVEVANDKPIPQLLEVLTFSSPSLRGLDMEMEAPVHTVPASAVRL